MSRCSWGAVLWLSAVVWPAAAANAGALVGYYFNENSNTAPSLASATVATVADTNRVVAGNATAGAGLGQFGSGTVTANTHGYGTGGYVSAPTSLYVRANVTAADEASAIAGNDYVSCTLAPRLGSVLNLTAISAWFRLQAATTLSASLAVRSSLDGFAADVASFTVVGNSSSAFTLLTNSLRATTFTNLVNPVEFRFYLFDNTSNTADILRLDDVGFFGTANAPPAPLQVLSLAASTPYAWESGGNGAFTVQRFGDASGSLPITYVMSGTAFNGVDYSFLGGVTNLPAGATNLVIPVCPINDLIPEAAETVVLTLQTNAGYVIAGTTAAVVTVLDDDSLTNANVLLEAENFTTPGGWVVDQQFVDLMGSPYLLAHGKGHPVADAVTTALFPALGNYHLWVRTKDWTAPLTNHPGAFKVLVGGVTVAPVFGTTGQGWLWQDGGVLTITNPVLEVRLRDLTGFDGRCDAVFFSADLGAAPPNDLASLGAWRRTQLGRPATPPSAGNFDLVVVGGGIAGSAAAISAARQGLSVALVHDRPFPGGNASQDVRVHTLGVPMDTVVTEINTPNYAIGSDQFIQSDLTRLQVLQAETNLQLFTEWRAFAANTNGAHITSIDARHTRTGEERRFTAPLFIDSTGDGWIGYWAGALYRTGREASSEFGESLAPTHADTMTQGSTLSWNSVDTGQTVVFPAVPWATNVSKDYAASGGDWYWEYGLTRDTIYDAEDIRDHLFQAIYGSFATLKQNSAYATLDLGWVGYIAGKRESRRLMGDYLLTQSDVINHPAFPDAVVTEEREIDIHAVQPGIYDFLTDAQYTSISSYWIPFRCLYSTNIDNLMMAGRCLSATHVGLGSPRVMNTCGQMGVATGTAAALCKRYSTTPRGIYQTHASELRFLMGLAASSSGPSNAVSVIDDQDTNHVAITGAWTSSTSVAGYYGTDYLHDGNTGKGTKSILFRPVVPLDGLYQVYLRWTAGANRATNVPVDINAADGTHTLTVNQTLDPAGWFLLGAFPFNLGTVNSVVIRTTGTSAYVIADAVALAADFALDPRFTGFPWNDDDGDGFCNYVEWLNGTDPLDPGSFLSLRLTPQKGVWQLRFQAMAGCSYSVQYRDSLAGGGWVKLADCVASNLTYAATIPDPGAGARASRFYRLVTPSLP